MADPFTAIASLGTGMVGQALSANDRAASRRAIQRAMRSFTDIELPELQQMIAEELGPSAMEGVEADPGLERAQYEAQGELGRISDSGGITLEDRANYEEAQRAAAQGAQRQRQSILNLMRREGSPTQGASVAAQLGAVGDQQEAAALAGQRMASDGQRRATQAVLERGRLAGAQRGQQFDERSRRAAATDAVQRYNAAARQTAQGYNLSIPQQQFGNQMARAGGIANTATGAANHYDRSADRTASMYANLGPGIGQTIEGFRSPTTSYNIGSDPNLDARLQGQDDEASRAIRGIG